MKTYSLIILTFFPAIVYGQNLNKLIECTRDEFELGKKMETPLLKNDKIIKTDGTIVIKTRQGKVVKFVDNLTDEDFKTHEYIGDLIKDKVVLIKTQDYNSDCYAAVDLATGEQQTLVGFPIIYKNNIVCLQGVKPDTVQEIEFWKIRNDKLINIKTFNLSGKLYPSEIVWGNANEVIIRDSKDTFWKMRIDGN